MIAEDPAAPADGAQVEGVQRALARIAEIGERLPVGTGFADVLAPHLAPEPFPAPVAPPVTEDLVDGRLDPSQLVAVSGMWTGTGMLLPQAAVAWEAMRREAAADGITLLAVDTYRRRETQAAARAEYEAGRKDAYVAPPGESRHGLGLAVDLTNGHLIGPGDREWEWMVANGPRFGWGPISTESWHWEYRGPGA